MQVSNRCMSRIGDRHVTAPIRLAPRSTRPQRRPIDGNFSVILPHVTGQQWRIVPAPSGQKLVAVDNKSSQPTDEEIIAVAAPLFMLLIAAMAMIPFII